MYFDGGLSFVALAAFGSHMNNVYGTALSENRPMNRFLRRFFRAAGRQRDSLNQPLLACVAEARQHCKLLRAPATSFRGIILIGISITNYWAIFRDEYFARFS